MNYIEILLALGWAASTIRALGWRRNMLAAEKELVQAKRDNDKLMMVIADFRSHKARRSRNSVIGIISENR